MPENGQMRSLLDAIERVPVSSLHLYPGNARRGQVGVIAESLTENAQYTPLVVQKSTRNVLSGNHTLKAALSLGWQEIDVVLVDVDDDRARKINISANRTGDLATWDVDQLTAQLETFDADDLVGTGWTIDQVARFTRRDVPDDGAGFAQRFELVVELPDQPAQARLFDRLTAEGFTCRVLTL